MCANLNTMPGDFPCQADNATMAQADTETAFAPAAHKVDLRSNVPPKVDRVTFNYGRALGRPKHDPIYDELVPPYDRKDAAAQYDAMEAFAHSMGAIGLQFTHASWAMDMALRDIRCSET